MRTRTWKRNHTVIVMTETNTNDGWNVEAVVERFGKLLQTIQRENVDTHEFNVLSNELYTYYSELDEPQK